MLFIAVNSPNLARQHWEGKKTAKRPNNFDWDCCIAEVHQPTQDKRYKNGVSLCGFPPTVEQGTTWISHGRGFWNQRPQSRGMVWWAFMWAVCSKAFRDLYFIRQIRKHLSEDATKVLVHAFVTSRLVYCNYPLFGFQNTNVIGCRGFLAAAATRIVCLVPKFSHHTPAFIIYIVYQCTSATSATRPPSSRWYWPCLPKEVSKFQREWSLQFKM